MKQALVGRAGVRFPALLLTMISRKALIAGLVGLVFVAGGTASVLDSFGSVSGTADVRPAFEFREVQATNDSGEYVLVENVADQKVNVSRLGIYDGGGSSDNLSSTNSTDFVDSGQYLLITTENMQVDSYSGGKKFIKASTGDQGLTTSLSNNGETLTVSIDGSGINTMTYAGDCSASEAETVGGNCKTPTFEVSSQ